MADNIPPYRPRAAPTGIGRKPSRLASTPAPERAPAVPEVGHAMEFEISPTAFEAAKATQPADQINAPREPLALATPAHASRFQTAVALSRALDTVGRWQAKGDHLITEPVRQAQALLGTALLAAYPSLGVERRLMENPENPHTAVRLALQGTKLLNDAADASQVDAVFFPARNKILEEAVHEVALQHPGVKVDFALEDSKGALLVVHQDLEQVISWKEALDEIVRPRMVELVNRFLTDAAARLPERAEKIEAVRQELTRDASALMHLGVAPIPPRASPIDIIQAIAGADTSAKLAREHSGPAGSTDANRGVFTPDKIAGALREVQTLATRLRQDNVRIQINGIEHPLMLRSPDESSGAPWIFNLRVLRELRKASFEPERPEMDAPAIADLRRALELCGLVDFVHYGKREDMKLRLPIQLRHAHPIFDGLLVGESVDLDELRQLLTINSSGAPLAQGGRPSAIPFYEHLGRRRDHGLVAFDLKGLGAQIQNMQFAEASRLANQDGPLDERALFLAKTNVNDAVQDIRATFIAQVNRALLEAYEEGANALGLDPATLTQAESLRRAISRDGEGNLDRLPRDTFLVGGDELLVAIRPEMIENPVLRDILARHLNRLRGIRVAFTVSHATDDSPEAAEQAHAAALRELDAGTDALKTVEGLWTSIDDKAAALGEARQKSGLAPFLRGQAQEPYTFDARRQEFYHYEPRTPDALLAQLETLDRTLTKVLAERVPKRK